MNNTIQQAIIFGVVILLFIVASLFGQSTTPSATPETTNFAATYIVIGITLMLVTGGSILLLLQRRNAGSVTEEETLIPMTDPHDLPPFSESPQEKMCNPRAVLIEHTLTRFGAPVTVVDAQKGPRLTRYEVRPGESSSGRPVRVKGVRALAEDLGLELAAKVRIAAIANSRNIGIEVPNEQTEAVTIHLADIMSQITLTKEELQVPLGVDLTLKPYIIGLTKMPHALIGGATGSGKSVFINSILISLLLRFKPSELKLILIDPKQVELMPYDGIPHLVSPVVVDPLKAQIALEWAVNEMERRYTLLRKTKTRKIESYNKKVALKLPYIVIVIDELADLIMVDKKNTEKRIIRLTQKARAAGMHLILSTQRPSTDVVTGLIKTNSPTRISFAMASKTDSRVILDVAGAEVLLGMGDLLYLAEGTSIPQRLQGLFVSDDEIEQLVARLIREGGGQVVDIFDTPSEPNAIKKPHWREMLPLLAYIRKTVRPSVRITRDHVRLFCEIGDREMGDFIASVRALPAPNQLENEQKPATNTDGRPTTAHYQPLPAASNPTTNEVVVGEGAEGATEGAKTTDEQEQVLAHIRKGESLSAAIATVYNTRGGNKYKRISQEIMLIIAQRI